MIEQEQCIPEGGYFVVRFELLPGVNPIRRLICAEAYRGHATKMLQFFGGKSEGSLGFLDGSMTPAEEMIAARAVAGTFLMTWSGMIGPVRINEPDKIRVDRDTRPDGGATSRYWMPVLNLEPS